MYTYTRGPERYHHVISLVNRLGIIEPQATQDEIPIFERYFLGGPNTVRGFKFRELGPHEGSDPIGGGTMLYGNLEYTIPLFYQRFLRLVAFFDYGNLSPDLSTFTFGEMRYVVGGGVKINFPLLGQPLPIGLYLGFPLAKERDDETRTFLFTIGLPF
jgi:outer membrane protein insertion porin family